jgi:hypothetical protein
VPVLPAGAPRRAIPSHRPGLRIGLADPVSYTLGTTAAHPGGARGTTSTSRQLLAWLEPPGYASMRSSQRRHLGETALADARSRWGSVRRGAAAAAAMRGGRACSVQWLGLPRYDLRWLRSAVRERPVVFTAHDVFPRRTASKVDLWRQVFETVDRVIVHG